MKGANCPEIVRSPTLIEGQLQHQHATCINSWEFSTFRGRLSVPSTSKRSSVFFGPVMAVRAGRLLSWCRACRQVSCADAGL